MSQSLLFPRLPPAAARRRLTEIAGRPATELRQIASALCAEAIYPGTGGTRVTEQALSQVREELMEQAVALGFPSHDGAEAVRFDWSAGPLLLQRLRMQPGEASRTDVWSFLTLQLLPDIATWRFPNQNDRRFFGGVRNTFQRLWWRARLLHEPTAADPWHLMKLPEDALVGLLERPGISSNSRVTRSIASAISESIKAVAPARRESSWRIAYKRIRQRIPLVNLDALEHSALKSQVSSIVAEAFLSAQ